MKKTPEWPKSRPIVIQLNEMPQFFALADQYYLQMINVVATEGSEIQIGSADVTVVEPGKVGLEVVIANQEDNEHYWDFLTNFIDLRN